MRTTSGLTATSAATAEAEMISRATKTAIVAARSILMSGGSNEIALKTAKAAAEAAMMNDSWDDGTVSGLSTFGRKRKVKRQAEVVSSMALTTATASLRANGSGSVHENDSIHGRNIFTHSRDEPSVLSGSFSGMKQYKAPSPRSQQTQPTVQSSLGPSMSRDTLPPIAASYNRTKSNDQLTLQMQSKISAGNDQSKPPVKKVAAPKSPKPAEIAIPDEHDDNISALVVAKQPPINPRSNFLDKILNMNAGTPKESNDNPKTHNGKKSSKITDVLFNAESESSSINNSGTMDSDNQSSSVDDTSASEGETIYGDASTVNDTVVRRDQKTASQSFVDPIVSHMINAFSLVTCTPIGAFADKETFHDLEDIDTMYDDESKASESSSRRSKRDRKKTPTSSNRSAATVEQSTSLRPANDTTALATHQEGRDDVEEDPRRGTKNGLDPVRSGNKERRQFFDQDFGMLIEARSTGSSFLQQLNNDITSVAESSIQLRSTLRETMEKIVSKSKGVGNRLSAGHASKNNDQTDEQSTTASKMSSRKSKKIGFSSNMSVSSKTSRASRASRASKAVGKKAAFFFKKHTPKTSK